MTAPAIASPLRMLLLSAPETPPSFLKDVSHHEIRTPYYNAAIPIWRDELPTSSTELETWKAEWLGQEAGEVVQAVGAWVVCFKKPREKADLVRQSLPPKGRVEVADGDATWAGYNTESTSHNP